MPEGWGEGFWKVCVIVCSRYSVFLALGLWDSWKEGQCEPVSASQIVGGLLPGGCGGRLLEV